MEEEIGEYPEKLTIPVIRSQERELMNLSAWGCREKSAWLPPAAAKRRHRSKGLPSATLERFQRDLQAETAAWKPHAKRSGPLLMSIAQLGEPQKHDAGRLPRWHVFANDNRPFRTIVRKIALFKRLKS